jgi:hypothetical protein
MAATDTTTPPKLTAEEFGAVYGARHVLAPHRNHPLIGPILSRLDLLADPISGVGATPDESGALAKLEGRIEDLRKVDPSMTRTAALEEIRKSDAPLMRAVAAGTRGVPLDDEKAWGRQERGSVRPGGDGSAYQQLREKARQLQSAHPDMGMEAALERARHENRDLERQMAAEMGKAA